VRLHLLFLLPALPLVFSAGIPQPMTGRALSLCEEEGAPTLTSTRAFLAACRSHRGLVGGPSAGTKINERSWRDGRVVFPQVTKKTTKAQAKCRGVRVFAGADLQKVINARAAGTVFCLLSGNYSVSSPLRPKNNQRFISATRRGAVVTGNNSTSMAFNGDATSGVVIRGLVIEKFDTPRRNGMAAVKTGVDWTVVGNEVRGNAALGIFHEARAKIKRNFVHHNSWSGIFGYKAHDSTIKGNEVAYNGGGGGPDNGGGKWVAGVNLAIRNNYFHNNHNNGIWVNADNLNIVIEGNRVKNNQSKGIHYETSCAGVVRENIVVGNGLSGLELVASQNVEVYKNVFRGNANAIRVWHQELGAGSNCSWKISSVRIHENTTYMTEGLSGLWKWNVSDGDSIFNPSDGRVRFFDNTYHLNGTANYFQWANGARSVDEWKSYGQDVNGTFIQD
jgi:parallel beta-helix repeat protein